jgi:hypothetical protein
MEQVDFVGNEDEAPSIEQWVARDKLMLKIDADANFLAEKMANNGNSYFYGSEGHHHHHFLKVEMENCFRCGNWLATICMSAATIETFLSAYFDKGSKMKRGLEAKEFPFIVLYEEIIDARNSIMHLRNKSLKKSFHSKSYNELFKLSKKAIWLVYVLIDYVLYKHKR